MLDDVNTALKSELNWPRALGPPSTRATIRTRAEDFVVEEELGFEPDGEGEHCLLQLEKRLLSGRAAFKDAVNGIMFERDQLVYIMFGATIKL